MSEAIPVLWVDKTFVPVINDLQRKFDALGEATYSDTQNGNLRHDLCKKAINKAAKDASCSKYKDAARGAIAVTLCLKVNDEWFCDCEIEVKDQQAMLNKLGRLWTTLFAMDTRQFGLDRESRTAAIAFCNSLNKALECSADLFGEALVMRFSATPSDVHFVQLQQHTIAEETKAAAVAVGAAGSEPLKMAQPTLLSMFGSRAGAGSTPTQSGAKRSSPETPAQSGSGVGVGALVAPTALFHGSPASAAPTPAKRPKAKAAAAAVDQAAATSLRALFDTIDTKVMGKEIYQVRCSHPSEGVFVIILSGSWTAFGLNKTIAQAYGWATEPWEEHVNKGAVPAGTYLLRSDGDAVVAISSKKNSPTDKPLIGERDVKVCQLFVQQTTPTVGAGGAGAGGAGAGGDGAGGAGATHVPTSCFSVQFHCPAAGGAPVTVTLDGHGLFKHDNEIMPRVACFSNNDDKKIKKIDRLNTLLRGSRSRRCGWVMGGTTAKQLREMANRCARNPLFDAVGSRLGSSWD